MCEYIINQFHSYPFMIWLCEELRVSILEYEFNFHTDREYDHRHYKCTEYAFA